ncbi:MAG: hypothetical protein COV52_07995 [Gammaproteobacteria bacterium CG11_big_fil_rev_8_21_14_0_20_46_22]|nr:MAG: hypothetical protein COW05_04075 [Gammaproteobacteria bacterium CG12_big_fil_rev_8_21_14_0_65_46_12]PIR10696.1 MAG: hypothetical protein COV52_07995 [Gammaproteobacteria bacterium CG11_big_fil_rev_8_21_14_0_20_46_22]
MSIIQRLDTITSWQPEHTPDNSETSLEQGHVIYCPNLHFSLSDDEQRIITPTVVAKNRKNASYNPNNDKLSGVCDNTELQHTLHTVMKRFARSAERFAHRLLPHYAEQLSLGRTSFRPVEIDGREAPSIRKDDKRLHVDAFPSTPMQDKRILRLFCNVNPEGKPRCWRTGEPFNQLAERFAKKLKAPFPGLRRVSQLLGITRRYQTLYDHYMLALHHTMKEDTAYQNSIAQEPLALAAGATWLCFTDSVSHAVDSGQYLFEQTFYLSYTNMQNPALSPQAILQTHFKDDLLTT